MEWVTRLPTKAQLQLARHVHLGAAAERQDRPQKAEDDQQQEGDDVVGDGMEAHRQDAGDAQRAVLR